MYKDDNPPPEALKRTQVLIARIGGLLDQHMLENEGWDGVEDILNATCSLFATSICKAQQLESGVFDQVSAMLKYHIFHSAIANGVEPPASVKIH
jgi:hypothetical protein